VPTATTLAISAITLTLRAPTRSMTGPPAAFATTYGSISAKPTSPVLAALPVVVRTNQGSATIDSRVPARETTFAVSQLANA
jgi:hypothetical protein